MYTWCMVVTIVKSTHILRLTHVFRFCGLCFKTGQVGSWDCQRPLGPVIHGPVPTHGGTMWSACAGSSVSRWTFRPGEEVGPVLCTVGREEGVVSTSVHNPGVTRSGWGAVKHVAARACKPSRSQRTTLDWLRHWLWIGLVCVDFATITTRSE